MLRVEEADPFSVDDDAFVLFRLDDDKSPPLPVPLLMFKVWSF